MIKGFLGKEGTKHRNNSPFSTWEAKNNGAAQISPEASVMLSIFNDSSNEVE